MKERFDKVDGSRAFNVHQEIATCTQGTQSISEYYMRLKDMGNEFSFVIPALAVIVRDLRTSHISPKTKIIY